MARLLRFFHVSLLVLVFSGAAAQITGKKISTAPEVLNNQLNPWVVAGDSTGLVPGNQFIDLTQGAVPFGTVVSVNDSLDLNKDGIFDAVFYSFLCNTFDCLLSSTYVAGLHSNFTFIDGFEGVKRLEEGDSIFISSNWNNQGINHTGGFISKGSGLGGTQNSGEWLDKFYGYMGFMLITPQQDTLLGWMHVFTYSLAANGAHIEVDAWAIQPDPSQKPFVEITATPIKPVYCAGDTVMLTANAISAEHLTWHLWNGTTDTTAIISVVLPDSSVVVSLTAGNAAGDTTISIVFEVSPLEITVPPVTLSCFQPSGVLSATTNIPAKIWWVVGNDTLPVTNPPVIVSPVPVYAFARDSNGCYAVSPPVEIVLDADIPVVNILFQEDEHLLIAQSSTPGVVFEWYGNGQTFSGDSVFVTQSGLYSVVATGLNGCTAVSSIVIELTGTTTVLQAKASIQPNPFNDYLLVENQGQEEISGSIIDLAGKIMIENIKIAAGSAHKVDTEQLPPGMYFFVGRQGQSTFFKKIIK